MEGRFRWPSNVVMGDDLERAQYEEVYVWVDEIPLSRPRRNIHRDFSDGVMFAEVVQYFLPRLVELHNYIPANSVKQKRQNWQLLWRKVLPRLNIKTSDVNTESVVQGKPGEIEKLLFLVKHRLESTTDSHVVSDSSSNMQEMTPPSSDRHTPPAAGDVSSPDQSLRQDLHSAAESTETAALASVNEKDSNRLAVAASPISSPGSMIPVKKSSSVGPRRNQADQGRFIRSKITSKRGVSPAKAGRADPQLHEPMPQESVQTELVRLRQLTIEQAEEISVLTARCCKLQKLLELRDYQLQQQQQ